jgi:hypothetical protein
MQRLGPLGEAAIYFEANAGQNWCQTAPKLIVHALLFSCK